MAVLRAAWRLPNLISIALIAGCGSPLGAGPQAATPQMPAASESSSGALLYVSHGASGVTVLSYPSGKKIGRLTGFAQGFGSEGLCTDRAGHVFVTGRINNDSTVYEFAHGGSTPIATLAATQNASGCSVSPATADLAVCNFFGTVTIFKNARGKPKYYGSFKKYGVFAWCAYDDSGNLFVSHYEGQGLLELPNGKSTFKEIQLSSYGYASSIQRMGEKFAISSFVPKRKPQSITILRVKVAGSTGKVIGTTTLQTPSGKPSKGQFWIDGANIVGPGYADEGLFMWDYPAGGAPIMKLGNMPVHGVAVSH